MPIYRKKKKQNEIIYIGKKKLKKKKHLLFHFNALGDVGNADFGTSMFHLHVKYGKYYCSSRSQDFHHN